MKKFLSLVLSLLMLALPMSGMAMTTEEIIEGTIATGGAVAITSQITMDENLKALSEEMAPVIDLYNSLSETVFIQNNQLTTVMNIGDASLGFRFEVTDNALYIDSSLLEKPIVLDATELSALAKNYILPMLTQQGVITEEDAATFSGWVDQILAGEIPEELQNMLMTALQAVSSATEGMSMSTENTLNWAMNLVASAEQVDASGLGIANVSTGIVINITAQDLIDFCNALEADLKASTIPVLDMIAAQAGADTATLVGSFFDGLRSGMEGDAGVSLAMYFDDTNGDLAVISVAIAAGEQTITCTYVNADSSSVVIAVKDNDTAVATISFTWTVTTDAAQSKVTDFVASIEAAGQSFSLVVKDVENTVDLPWETMDAALNFGDTTLATMTGVQNTTLNNGQYESDVKVTVSLMSLDIINVNVGIVTMDALESIATPDAVRLFSSSAEELNAWAEGAMAYAQNGLMQLVQALPESLLAMMN